MTTRTIHVLQHSKLGFAVASGGGFYGDLFTFTTDAAKATEMHPYEASPAALRGYINRRLLNNNRLLRDMDADPRTAASFTRTELQLTDFNLVQVTITLQIQSTKKVTDL